MGQPPRTVDRLSLAEFQMMLATWNAMHKDPNKIDPPSDEEYYAMMEAFPG